MEIIRRFTPPNKSVFYGKCQDCGIEVKAEREEVQILCEWEISATAVGKCPQCKREIYFSTVRHS